MSAKLGPNADIFDHYAQSDNRGLSRKLLSSAESAESDRKRFGAVE